MVAPDHSREDARPDPQAAPSPSAALEPWTTPTVRVLAVSETEGGEVSSPTETGFYAPQS